MFYVEIGICTHTMTLPVLPVWPHADSKRPEAFAQYPPRTKKYKDKLTLIHLNNAEHILNK